MSEHEKYYKADLMSEILSVRYDDLEQERKLCLELLSWAKEKEERYGEAFAHTYLGDYYIAQNLVVKAKEHFDEAEEYLSKFDGACDELFLRIYSLHALYYKMIADEQTSMQYYMQALHKARIVGDTYSEGIILNNIGTAFLRHKSFEEARYYMEEACRLMSQWEDRKMRTITLSNLSELLLTIGETDEARKRIEECDKVLENFPEIKDEISSKNWCIYCAAIQDEEKALMWADRILNFFDVESAIPLNMFDDYTLLFNSIYSLGNKQYSKLFLELMEKTKIEEVLEQPWIYEECRIMYCLRFEPEERHADAYRNLYDKAVQMRAMTNKNIISAMKSKIALRGGVSQKEELKAENEDLERQASVDELTQVYNRRYFMQLMRERAISFKGDTLGIIMFDVDYFKEYNDYYGHLMGDKVLQAVSSCIWKHRTEEIYPCRYGGDEFVCLCDKTGGTEIEKFISAIRLELLSLNIAHEKSRCSDRITLSAGYSVGYEGVAPYLILQLSDLALYDSKLSGRNTFKGRQAGRL